MGSDLHFLVRVCVCVVYVCYAHVCCVCVCVCCVYMCRMCILASREHACIHPQVSKSKNKNDDCKLLLDYHNV